MAVGYQGIVFINDNQYLVTGGTLSPVRNPMFSEGAYVAGFKKIKSSDCYGKAVNRVHLYDFETVTADVNFEVNNYLLDELFANTDDDLSDNTKDINNIASDLSDKTKVGGWLINRHNPRKIRWYNNKELKFQSGKGFLTSLSLSAQPGNMVSCSLNTEIIPDHPTDLPAVSFNLSDDYIGQKFGIANDISELGPGDGYDNSVFLPFNYGVEHDFKPIPYWASKPIFDVALPDEVEVGEWEISVTNTFEKRFTCEGDISLKHPGPKFVFVGVAEISFTMTLYVVRTATEGTPVTLPERFDKVDIEFWSNLSDPNNRRKMRLGSVENQGLSQPLADVSSLQTYQYSSLEFFTLPYLV